MDRPRGRSSCPFAGPKTYLALLALPLAACSGGKHTVDAAPLQVMGEFVDWMDTGTDTGFFCGIKNAMFTVHDDPSQTDMTNPNGRFTLTIHDARTQVDITPPSAVSECSVPPSNYTLPAIMIIDEQVAASGAILSAREFTTAQTPAGFDITKAQVLVHVDGTPRAVSITGTHDAVQAFDGTNWAAGDTGVNVYFPNVDPSPGTTKVTTTGSALGTGSIPIAAGTFSFLTIVAS
jgi:hypothetical protein